MNPEDLVKFDEYLTRTLHEALDPIFMEILNSQESKVMPYNQSSVTKMPVGKHPAKYGKDASTSE